MSRILALSSADGTVEVDAEITLGELQSELACADQALPYGIVPGCASAEETIADLLSCGLPHPWEGAFGGWREWLLGAELELTDGLIAFSGARVVKSVAGFDVHRMLVGAGREYGGFRTAVLRTILRSRLPEERFEVEAGWIQRVLPSEFAAAATHPDIVARDAGSSTLWWRTGVDPVRREDDLLWRRGELPNIFSSDEVWFRDRIQQALSASARDADQ